MIGCKQPIIALYFEFVVDWDVKNQTNKNYFEFETVLKFYNLGAWCFNIDWNLDMLRGKDNGHVSGKNEYLEYSISKSTLYETIRVDLHMEN